MIAMRCIKDSKTISLSKLKYNTEQNIENNMIVFMLQKFRYIKGQKWSKSIIRPIQTPITLQIKKFKKGHSFKRHSVHIKKSINGKNTHL